MSKHAREFYLGIDVGGTKILAALATIDGSIIARKRMPTPRNTKAEHVVAAIADIIAVLLSEHNLAPRNLSAIGLAIPGTVAPNEGKIICTPNMPLSGVVISPLLEKRFKVPVLIGNDVNLGTLGEVWRGAARAASSVVGIFVGTGIGAGVVLNGHLIPGHRNAAGEIGHMVMQPGGPLCGCGNRGCLEALASRTAIERDIRNALKNGRKSVITRLADNDLTVIKSSVIKRALQQEDELVTEIIRKASETLGYACLNVRHLFDPELIILGGGVIEACGDFILPIVQQIVGLHSMPGSSDNDVISMSHLGDDAVVLGAVALAKAHHHPDEHPTPRPAPHHLSCRNNTAYLDRKPVQEPLALLPNGNIAKVNLKRKNATTFLTRKTLLHLCTSQCLTLVVGAATPAHFSLTPKARAAAEKHRISVSILTIEQACQAYHTSPSSVLLLSP
ncbi:MAG: ROK family protein [bacterium]|nr:ROK family protein [bacterium]